MKPLRAASVTIAIAAVTALAWLVQILVAGPHIVLQGGFVPVRAVAAVPFDSIPFSLTPLTATLLHGGLLHLGMNLLMLVVCGRGVEGVLGGGRLLVLYAVGAYGAAAAQYFADPASAQPMIGASGAISAVIGTYAMMFGRTKVRSIGPVPKIMVRALWLAAAWSVVQWGIGFASAAGPYSIATAAHIGGFITGLVMTVPLLEWRYRYG